MNIPIAMTLKGFANSQNLDYVPANGELVLDKETNLLKIGDGKTAVKNLQYISTVKADKETVPDYVKQIIKNYSNLIEENRFNELLDNIIPSAHTGVVRALLKAGIDVKSHLHPVPLTVKHLFNEKGLLENFVDSYLYDSSSDTLKEVTAYVDSKIESLYTQLSVPKDMLKGEQGTCR